MPFTGSTHGFRKDMDFLRMHFSVRTLDRRRTHEITWLDVGEAALRIGHNSQFSRNHDRKRLPIVSLDYQCRRIERFVAAPRQDSARKPIPLKTP